MARKFVLVLLGICLLSLSLGGCAQKLQSEIHGTKMNNLAKAEELAEKIRHEPLDLFNNCLTKSIRLKRECRALGIPARLVVCIGYVRTKKWFNRWLIVPVIHSWCDVEGVRVETARPVNEIGIFGVPSGDIKPVIAIRI